jgi:predicted DNA-binding transcriptional regulator AlpA
MNDVLFTPIRLNELEVLIENSVQRAIQNKDVLKDDNETNETPLDIKEISKFIKKTVPTIYGYCQRNEIPYSKNGNRLIFWKSEIIQWLKQGKVKTIQEIEATANTYLSNKNKAM